MCINKFIEPHPLIVAPDTLLSETITLMSQQKQGLSSCVLVLAATKVIGILTPGDVVRLVAQGVDLNTPVASVMTQEIITLERSQFSVREEILSLMQQHSIGYLPVLGDRQELIGVITRKSLIQSLEAVEKTSEPKSQHLEFSEAKFKHFFEITPSMLCIAGFDGYFQWVNPAFSEILGFTQQELVTEPFINFVHSEDRAATIAELENLEAGKTTISFENRYRNKAGKYRWFLWTAKPDISEQMIYAVAQDITERKAAEQALQESEERWHLALIGANDGIWDWNVKTNEVFFSRRWKEMLGFAEEEISNSLEEWSQRVHPDDIGWVMKLVQEHFARKTPFYISEHRVRCKDGSYKWILDRGQALWDKAGNVIRMSGSHADISERKQAEMELKQERDFCNTIINTVPALITVLDRQGAIVSFNHTCEEITGYSFEEIKGEKLWDFLITPEEQSSVKAVFEGLLGGQLPNQYENHWLSKDGSYHLIAWSNTALFDAQGIVEFVIATGIDITQKRQMWDKLELQYQQTKLLADITRKIRMSIDLKEILHTTVTEVQHLLACDRVLILEIGSNHTALPISEAILPNIPPMLGYELTDPLLVGEYLARYHEGKILAVNDVFHAPIAPEIKQLLAQFQVKAKLVVPIISQSKLKGLLVAHQCNHARYWQESEIQLLNQLADQIGVALSQAHLLDDLEELVAERTTELTTKNQLLQAEIVERQQIEAALRENQQKLAGILDNADEAIICIDEQQQIQLFNQGAEKIFGYQAQQIIGEVIDILFPIRFRQIHHQHITNLTQSSEQSRTMAFDDNNIYGLRKNGEEFMAEASISKLRTCKGMLFTLMLKDITEKQQAKEKLQASQNLLAKAEKIAKIGSWEYNLETQKLSWSEELFKILRFSKACFIPSCAAILERIHPEDTLLVQNTLKKGHNQGLSWQFNFRWLLPNGTIKYLETRGEPTVNRQGKVLTVWGTIMDVSDRIHAEQSCQRSEEQLRIITDALPVLIAYIDNQQRYLYNNRTYETWFGKSRSDIVGHTIKELFGSQNYQKMCPYIEIALSGKAVTFEIQPQDKNGNFYWMNGTYIPDLNSKGEVQGFFSMADDITSRKEIERMKSEFISIASHEMRTPLTSIHGVITLLCGGRLGTLSPRGMEMANMALRNSERLVHLVNDILDLERMESGKDTIHKQTCDSGELIKEAVETVFPIAQKQEIIIETEVNSLELWVDRELILQTLTNILSNGIKFSPAKSKIWVTSQLNNDQVLFTVRDQGRGIPQDKLETIFERFQQVDASDSRQKGGTGLGLAICRYIVEKHGGKIWAESTYGKGSTFFFTIPRKL